MYQNLLGLSGGVNATYWEVVNIGEPYSSKYWPAIVDGQEKMWTDFPDIEDYLAAKQERRRVTVTLTIAGNPIAAEQTIIEVTGKRCLATTPNSLDIYVVDDSVEE